MQAQLEAFKKKAMAGAGLSYMNLYPGTITVAGRNYSAAVKLEPVLLSIPGEGAIEHRGLTALIQKSDMSSEPAISSIVVHAGKDYIVNSFEGRESFEPIWKLICIEKDRS